MTTRSATLLIRLCPHIKEILFKKAFAQNTTRSRFIENAILNYNPEPVIFPHNDKKTRKIPL
jgi:hypothetical protein